MESKISGNRTLNHFSMKKLNGVYVFLALFAMAFIAYWPILNDILQHDDFAHYSLISLIPVSELWRIFDIQREMTPTSPQVCLRPFGWLVLWVINKIFGINPLPAHIFSVSVHAGSSFVFFWLMTRFGISRFAAFLAAILFVLSPISPGAVTWLADRFGVLALFFMLLALALYLVSIQNKSRAAFAGSMVAAAAGLLSKENAMILVILIPALEILFVSVPNEAATTIRQRMNTRLRKSGARLGVFFSLFTGFFIFRFFWLGGMGGYRGETFFTLQGIKTVPKSLLVMLMPLDRYVVSKTITIIFLIYIILLCLVTFGVVVFRWRYATMPLRKTMVFMVIFFIASFVPVWPAFVKGISFYMAGGSRLYYSSTCALIFLIVVGLIEFGWDRKSWRIASSIALIMLIPIYFYGLRENNKVWSYEPAISSIVAEETFSLVPDPPFGTKFYFQNLPKQIGAYQFGSDVPAAIMMKYGKLRFEFFTNPEGRDTQGEILVYFFNPDLTPEEYTYEFRGDASDGYLFYFDWDSRQLHLVHEPK